MGIMTTYAEWLEGKFTEWSNTQPRRNRSLTSFAKYLGVGQPSLSQWMAGNYPPSNDNVERLADKLGYEIYDILEMPRPNPMIKTLESLDDEDPDVKELWDLIHRWLSDHGFIRVE